MKTAKPQPEYRQRSQVWVVDRDWRPIHAGVVKRRLPNGRYLVTVRGHGVLEVTGERLKPRTPRRRQRSSETAADLDGGFGMQGGQQR